MLNHDGRLVMQAVWNCFIAVMLLQNTYYSFCCNLSLVKKMQILGELQTPNVDGNKQDNKMVLAVEG